MRIYYQDKKLRGKPYKGKITMDDFNKVVYNLGPTEIVFKENIFNKWLSKKRPEFKYVWIKRDDNFFNSRKGTFFLPKCLIFSDFPIVHNPDEYKYDYFFQGSVYILLSIDTSLEVRELIFKKPLEYQDTVNLDIELTNANLIGRIEKTFFSIVSKNKNQVNKPFEIPEEIQDDEIWIKPNSKSLLYLNDLLLLCTNNKEKVDNLLTEIKKTEGPIHSKYIKDLNENFELALSILFNLDIDIINGIIISLDVKFPLEEFKTLIIDLLENNYSIKNPALNNNYDEESEFAITGTEVFRDFDKDLKKYRLKIGFAEANGDEYVMFIHKIDDTKKIIDILEKVNKDYFDAYQT